MSRVAFTLVLGLASASDAMPSDDITGFCAQPHQGYRSQSVCVQDETAARKRIYRDQERLFSTDRAIWDYCVSLNDSWKLLEDCIRARQRGR